MRKLFCSTKIVLVTFFTISLLACTGEDGEDGAIGPIGPAGANGTDGINGADGVDGNANVQTYLFDISNETGPNFAVDVPQLTQDVIDNDLVVGYLKTLEGTYIPIPAPRYLDSGFGSNFMDVGVEIALGRFWVYLYQPGSNAGATVTAGNMTKLKVLIVESNSTTGKSGDSDLRKQLKEDGLDLNDYDAVMDYFSLEH
ncbi:hypothetical protein [Zobellia russellii]|uniref:hypothetical protein n=1 Tax=Zobellia russellii TaxID=248907 RepID=UPI0037DC220A